ncbi:MAG: M42 family peptidase, partial [Oscillospiraceae bacterium]
TGSAGAVADIAKITPDMAIAVDVSFADGFDIDKEKCGKLGGGVMVGLSPVLNRNLFKQMLKIAQEKNIKYQTEIMGGRTGTDADVVAMSKNGIKTALLSIPQRYMHTPCEVVSINDVKTVIDLIYEFAKEASV